MKQTITTVNHGLSRGDTVRIEGTEYIITQATETSFVLGRPMWWRRAWLRVSAAWSSVKGWLL